MTAHGHAFSRACLLGIMVDGASLLSLYASKRPSVFIVPLFNRSLFIPAMQYLIFDDCFEVCSGWKINYWERTQAIVTFFVHFSLQTGAHKWTIFLETITCSNSYNTIKCIIFHRYCFNWSKPTVTVLHGLLQSLQTSSFKSRDVKLCGLSSQSQHQDCLERLICLKKFVLLQYITLHNDHV